MGAKSFLASIPKKLEHEVENVISEGQRILGKQNPDDQEVDALSRRIGKIQHETQGDASQALWDEMRERVISAFKARGMTASEIEAYAKPRLIEIFKRAEKFRKEYQKSHPLKLDVRKITAKAESAASALPGLMVAGVAALFVYVYSTGRQDAERMKVGVDSLRRQMLSDQSRDEIFVSEADFRSLTERLKKESNLPDPPQAAVPMFMAEAAAAPVQVEVVSTGSGPTFRVRSTVAQVYDAVPEEAKVAIEREATMCTHDHTKSITIRSTAGTFSASGFFGKNRGC